MARKNHPQDSQSKRILIKGDRAEPLLITFTELLARIETTFLPEMLRNFMEVPSSLSLTLRSNIELLRGLKVSLKRLERASRKLSEVSVKGTILELLETFAALQTLSFPEIETLESIKLGPRVATVILRNRRQFCYHKLKNLFPPSLEETNKRTRILKTYQEKALLGNRNATKVELQGEIGTGKGEAIARLLISSPHVQSVDLMDSRAFRLDRVIYALNVNKTLKVIDISHNNIGLQGATAIAKMLKVNPVLQIMDLEDTCIGSRGIIRICRSLRVNLSLKKINLSHNNIDDRGMKVFAAVLATNRTIEKIDLQDNKIGNDGAVAIFRALTPSKKQKDKIRDRQESAVASLDLKLNFIGERGGEAIGQALRLNRSLQEIDLYRNRIGNQGAFAISSALQINKTIKHVNLNDNHIGYPGVFALTVIARCHRKI